MLTVSIHDVEPQAPDTPQEPTARRVFRQALTEVAEKARAALPTANGRIEAAVKLVLAGDVTLLADGKAQVASQSSGQTTYRLVNGTCDCRDFAQAPEQWCKHRLSAAIYKRASALAKARLEGVTHQESPESTNASAGDSPVPPAYDCSPARLPGGGEAHGIPPQFVVDIHGKSFVRYAGLLALAHEKGLTSLRTRFISVTADLALAEAEAIFADGRVFVDSADASPGNVAQTVKAHFPRVACTRAAARALRNALNIDLCAVEELE